MTRQQLAAIAGVTQSHITKCVNTVRRPRPALALKLAAATNTDPGLWIFGTSREIKAALAGAPYPPATQPQEGQAA